MDILTYTLLNKKVNNINEQIKDLTNEITLYKHRVNLTIIFDELPEVFTLEFLSKYNTPFVNNSSLADMLAFYSSLNDTHAIINPMVILGNTYAIISQIIPNGDTGIDISVVTNTTFVLNALYEDNASGITDTVTPYINFVGSAGGSGGGSSESNEGKIDYIEITSGQADTHFILTMPKGALDTQESITFFNNSISQLNSTFSVNIPVYSNINSLSTIATYINSLNDTTYLQLKSAFWTQMFFTINVSALSVKGYYLGHTSPIYIYAEPDTSSVDYGYKISMMDPFSLEWTTVWLMGTTLNFNVFVNQLD